MFLIYFIFGSCIGSFLHASAFRYGHPDMNSSRWSICSSCHHRLSFKEMIPCISWFFLKGKCRWCNAQIPVHSLLYELLGGILSGMAFYQFQDRQFFGVLIIIYSLLYSALTDALYGLIPNRTHILIILGAIVMISPDKLISSILFSMSVVVILSFIALITQGLGYGDVKLISSLALILKPYPLLVSISIASCTALLLYGFKLITNKIHRQTKIPFGPFLSFGAVVCLFFLQ